MSQPCKDISFFFFFRIISSAFLSYQCWQCTRFPDCDDTVTPAGSGLWSHDSDPLPWSNTPGSAHRVCKHMSKNQWPQWQKHVTDLPWTHKPPQRGVWVSPWICTHCQAPTMSLIALDHDLSQWSPWWSGNRCSNLLTQYQLRQIPSSWHHMLVYQSQWQQDFPLWLLLQGGAWPVCTLFDTVVPLLWSPPLSNSPCYKTAKVWHSVSHFGMNTPPYERPPLLCDHLSLAEAGHIRGEHIEGDHCTSCNPRSRVLYLKTKTNTRNLPPNSNKPDFK